MHSLVEVPMLQEFLGSRAMTDLASHVAYETVLPISGDRRCGLLALTNPVHLEPAGLPS